MLTISKDKSLLIKGIVICMMVWLHLFNGSHTELCQNLLYVGDEPFAKWLSNACGPVSFFLLLSGYGLAFTYEKGKLTVKGQAKRLFKLYTHYWVVLTIFVTLGSFLVPERYPGTLGNIIANMMGWCYTYNAEMWFLFPYCMVALVSPMLFRIVEHLGNSIVLLCSAIFYVVVCYCISRYGEYLYGNMALYRPVLFLQFLYPFMLGVVFFRSKILIDTKLPQWMAFVLVGLALCIMATFGNAVLYMVYVPLMVWLFCQLAFPKWLENMLVELGKKSMVIWMVHTWFCYYLFQPQVYSLRYPIVILGGGNIDKLPNGNPCYAFYK